MANKDKKLGRSLTRLGKTAELTNMRVQAAGRALRKIKPILKKIQSNEEFAKVHGPFIKACKKANVMPTARQASMYRRGLGKAFAVCNEQWRANAKVTG